MHDEDDQPVPTGDARTAYLLRRAAAGHASTPSTANSPSALDATLARISAEVTAEAAERLDDRERAKQDGIGTRLSSQHGGS